MATAARKQGDYTACIYVHGMGSQRRFEETCRLIDRMDAWVGAETDADGQPLRMLRGIEGKIEVPRDPADPDVAYIRAYMVEGERWSPAVRFHELYWAPVMAGQRSALGVARWMAQQIVRPLVTLQAPWRARPRLRRAALTAMFDAPAPPPGSEPGDYAALMDLYCRYENLESQRAVADGRFAGFLASIADANASEPVRTTRLQRLACAWRRNYVLSEWRNFFVLVTIGVSLLLGLGAAVAVLGWLFALGRNLLQQGPAASLAGMLPDSDPATLVSTAVALVLALGAGRFLTQYMADVQAWATFEETDEKFERRDKVIATGMRLFRHVLEDPACKRVTIVSHSLGTSVAHDVLFALARYNKARNNSGDPIAGPIPLDKIEHVVTLGSPIDKIEYFFESFVSPSHRFRRFREAMRGDIGTIPFTRNRDPHIHWINFWDDADLVSGALQSPASASGRRQRVDNVHVQTLRFPLPGRAHGAYFDDRRVVECLSAIIFDRAWSFETLPPHDRPGSKDRSPDYERAFLARDPRWDVPGARAGWHRAGLAMPWLALIAVAASLLDVPGSNWVVAAAVTLGIVLAVAVALAVGQPVLHPIPPRGRPRTAEEV